MKKLAYNEQMNTNGGRTVCCYTYKYMGKAIKHTVYWWFWSSSHKDYYINKCPFYNYGR